MENNMRVTYALSVYDDLEINAVMDVLKNHKTLMGEKTADFESKVSSLFGKKHGIMVNSGSSANFLAIELLKLPKDSEIITPALTFSTTVGPIIQKNSTPVFVDVELDNYLIDINAMKDSITENSKCLMIPFLLGNVPDLSIISKIAKDNNLYFIEDSCDTLGARLNGKPSGEYSDISTTSFYGSHIITAAGGGGMVCVNSDDWNRRCKVLRGWGRSSAIDESESLEKRFGVHVDGIEYDSKFIFEELGYNFLPLEICSAFGLEQLKKLPIFTKSRQNNFRRLNEFFAQYKNFFMLPKQTEKLETSWMHFPLTIKPDAPFSRLEIATFLEEKNIQTRPIFAGNILRQPGFKNINHNSFKKEYPNSDYIMKHGFLIGCHHGLTNEQLDYLESTFKEFLNKY